MSAVRDLHPPPEWTVLVRPEPLAPTFRAARIRARRVLHERRRPRPFDWERDG